MSKVDAQRAMREAKYARQKAAAASQGVTPANQAAARSVPSAAVKPAAPKPAASQPVGAMAAPAGELCGHKSMNNRTCTRPAGHSEKSHRYT